MDAIDVILASMAKATGNASAIPELSNKHSTVARDLSPKLSAENVTSVTTKKRIRHEPFETTSNNIWAPDVMQELPEALFNRALILRERNSVTPAEEVQRQQVVRKLCVIIRKAAEDMGIAKLPNSAYETWQFTSKLFITEKDPLIPHNEADYSGLLEEFMKAGAPMKLARKKCQQITVESDKLLRKFHHTVQGIRGSSKRVKVMQQETMVTLTYAHTSVKCSIQHYQKLKQLYERHQIPSLKQIDLESAVFTLLLRYDSLDGGGFQAALNEECFDVLLQYFNCQMECFASPFNCRYGRFCSAFPDTDMTFGSVGSFFTFKPTSGCYEANPPFIPKLIIKMSEHMTTCLRAAKDELAFIVIIPKWETTDGWKALRQSSYCKYHMSIPQKQHGYCEGKQQIRTTRWRIASFDTSVFFLMNAAARAKWPISNTLINDLTNAFRSKQRDERDALGLRHGGKRVKRI